MMSAVLVLANAMPLFAYGEGETPAEFFQFDENTGTITKFLKDVEGAPTEVVIPREIDEVTVKCVGRQAFSFCESVTSITIPDSVTSIGQQAFTQCEKLTSVTIPNGVESIESATFKYCYALTSLTLPDSLTSIKSMAFSHCVALTSINLPESVTSIDTNAFHKCWKLTNITIPKNVETLGSAAFTECSRLNEIYVDQLEEECPFADTKPWGAPDTCEVTFKPLEGPVLDLQTTGYSITLEWEALEDVDGYEVERKEDDSEFDQRASTSEMSYKDARNLAEGKEYAYRVRGYKEVDDDKLYTKWSNVVEHTMENDSVDLGVENTTVTLALGNSAYSNNLTWTKSEGYRVDGYQVYRKEGNSNFEPHASTSKLNYTETRNLAKGTVYAYKVRGYRVIDGDTKYTEWSNVVERTMEHDSIDLGVANTTIELELGNSGSSNNLTWKKSPGYRLDGYEVHRKEADSDFKLYDSTPELSYLDASNLAKGKEYSYRVRGYRKIDGKKKYTKWSNIESRVAAKDSVELGVTNSTVTLKLGGTDYSNNLTWTKSAGYKVDGYQVWRRSAKSDKYYSLGSTSETSYKDDTKLYKGQTYYYKVRGYRKIDGKYVYTEWSNVRSRVAKKHSTDYGVMYTTINLNMTAQKGVMKLTWKKSAGYSVHGYQVWRRVGKDGKYVRYGSTKNTYYNNAKGLVKGKQYYYKVRGWRKISGEYVYTKWSNIRMRTAI